MRVPVAPGILALASCAFAFGVAPGIAAAAEADPLAQVDDWLAAERVPGAVVVVIDGGAAGPPRAFGRTSIDGDEPMPVDAVFEAASLGKMVVAWALAIDFEAGYIDPGEPLTLPRIDSACGPPSATELLSHSAGLGNDIESARFTMDCTARGEFAYAGEGYTALEAWFGGPVRTPEGVAASIDASVLTPLAMHASTFDRSQRPLVPGHVDALFAAVLGYMGNAGYVAIAMVVVGALGIAIGLALLLARRGEPVPGVLVGLVTAPALLALVVLLTANRMVVVPSANAQTNLASSFKTTAWDLGRFTEELILPLLISPTTRDQLFEPVVRIDDGIAWAQGFGVEDTGGQRTWWHWGSNIGYQSLLVVDPVSGRGVVVLTNGGGDLGPLVGRGGGYAVGRRIAREVMDIDGRWSL